ncbi:metallophosphoesterase [Caenimonas soli]|uniref:metallophosphoesterase n=1 Tax=Caenimonas soli TaxID=2735555 RepID=UPI00155785CA|nr:metallophosphoesterase [Caenimonas soli]NPC58218.1 metallophosphoesterase [Caenimonas soli]
MPLTYLLGLSAALHLYIGARIVPPFPGAGMATLFALLLVASALMVPVGMLSRRLAKPPVSDTLAWVGLLFLGLFSSLFVFTVLRDAVLLLAWIASLIAPAGLALDGLRMLTAAAVPVLGIAVTFVGFLNARRTAQVKRVEIPLAGLPAGLHGFTIVQISDVHVGPTIRARYVEGIVEAVNRLNPDLVAITGDLVDGSVLELGAQVAPLSRLVSKHGSYFVTGNHEYYSGVEPWLVELHRLGIKVLHNEHVVIERGGAKLVLAGVPDYSAGHFDEAHRSDARAAVAGAPAGAVKLLLAHQPRSAPAAAEAGFDLQLSGHTHGGQFLPWRFFVQFQQPFTSGLHKVGRMWIYVSRGTGYWGPPKRFGAPSEITELRLVASAV